MKAISSGEIRDPDTQNFPRMYSIGTWNNLSISQISTCWPLVANFYGPDHNQNTWKSPERSLNTIRQI